MVLEPLSAFSVACNVLQIIEFGSKLLSKAIDYRKAANELSEHQDLRHVLQSLKNLNADLQASMPQLAGTKPPSTAETRLLEANTECLRLSSEFIDLLDRLKVKNRHAMLECLRMSIKSLWYKEKMDAMESALSQARDNLNVAFLVYMKYTSDEDLCEIYTDECNPSSKQATATTQNDILRSTTRVEGSILNAISSSSGSMQNEIRLLAEQLENTNLDSVQQTVAEFLASNRDLLENLSDQLDSIFTQHNDLRTLADECQVANAQQKVLDSLQFSQIQGRRDRIHRAHRETYQWILRPMLNQRQRWDSLTAWLASSEDPRRIYWIYGKPGSGKSTLMRFLDENIHVHDHMLPWAEHSTVDTLHEYMLCTGRSTKVFLLVDGLDEFEGTDEKREELIDLFKDLASLENVKICLSSRPWNIFQDAFGEFPQLRLEDLTHNDISTYVEAQLHSHIRFQHLLRYDQVKAQSLIVALTGKAAGVFLWVRLVVRELLKGLRDGDGIRALWKKLEEIPSDLNDYFKCLMDSIGHHHRREASALLQIALHEEHAFAPAHPLRLIDLSFIEEERPDFALKAQYSFRDLDLADREGLQFRLDSTIRRLNSRCMGLLECQYQPNDISDLLDLEPQEEGKDALCEWDVPGGDVTTGQSFEPSIYPTVFGGPNLLRAFNLTVDFLHRSCRDFLLTPETQSLLHQYTQGPYDARTFLRNSRLVQFVALEAAGVGERLAAAIASYLLSTLSLPSCRHAPSSAVAATIMQPVIENLVRNHRFSVTYWYIDPALASWHEEGSSFLTLAIDFELSSYVRAYLTSQRVQKKIGRPILDYILRPRFAEASMGIGNSLPNLELLRVVLEFGADPNEHYEFVSVWALFLCFLADVFMDRRGDDTFVTKLAYFGALEMLIHNGAAALLPRSWLSDQGWYENWLGDWALGDGPEERFSYRWPLALPAVEASAKSVSEPWYAVGDLLENFRPHFGPGVDKLKGLLESRNKRQK